MTRRSGGSGICFGIGIIALGVVCAQCSLSSLDGFSGVTPASDGGDGSPDDGLAPNQEGGGLLDSDGSARFCATLSPRPTLCSDFDTLPFAAEWNELRESGGGLARPDSTSAVSLPTSFSASTPPIPNGATPGRARVCHDFVHASRIQIAFDVRVMATDPTSEFALASIRFRYPPVDGGEERRTYVDIDSKGDGSGNWQLTHSSEINGSKPVPITFAPPTLDKWTRVALDATVTANTDGTSSIRGRVLLDGQQVADSVADWPTPTSGSDVCLGLTYVLKSVKTITMLHDNVTVVVTP